MTFKWIYKMKYHQDGSVQRHKACLVAREYTHQPRIDFEEIFALVARMEIMRLLLALVA